MANKYRKYNGDGSINKVWAYVEAQEHSVEATVEAAMQRIYAYSQKNTGTNLDSKYEAVFQFIKRHCPEKSDSEIAMEVLHSLK